jgi:hypothetical protein
MNLMLPLQLLVKIPHVNIEILLPVLGEHLLEKRQWYLLGSGFLTRRSSNPS